MNDVIEITLKNILDKRLLLTKKIVIMEKFFDICVECDLLNININKNKNTVIKIKKMIQN